MHIVFDARFYGLEHTGIGRYVTNVLKELEHDTKNTYTLLLPKKYMDAPFPSHWNRVEASVPHYSLLEQWHIPKLIRSLHPDLVHFPHFNVPFFVPAPYVVTIHDLLMHRFSGFSATTLSPITYLVKRAAYKGVFRHAVTRASKIIVPTEFVKGDLLAHYPTLDSHKVTVLYEGVDSPKKIASVPQTLTKHGISGDYVIYVGNAYPHKNLERAIDAFHHALTDKPTTFVIVTGRNVFYERLKKYVAKHPAKNNVKVLGFVDDSELYALYKGAKAFIYPSLFEGFGLPGLEALSVGCPVVASDIPVFREVYKNAVSYFNPEDVSSIAQAITTVVKGKDIPSVSVRNALLARYSWKTHGEKTQAVYTAVK